MKTRLEEAQSTAELDVFQDLLMGSQWVDSTGNAISKVAALSEREEWPKEVLHRLRASQEGDVDIRMVSL